MRGFLRGPPPGPCSFDEARQGDDKHKFGDANNENIITAATMDLASELDGGESGYPVGVDLSAPQKAFNLNGR